jgi:HTH-type transcriptional regulator/antitoxin HigA
MPTKRATRNRRRKPPAEEYFALVRAHPLLPIACAADHAEAMRVLEALADREPLSPAAGDYLSVLASLVHEYEREAFPGPKTDGVDTLKFLLEEHGLSVAALGRETGIPATSLFEVLSRRRGISPRVRAKLCERFGVEPAAFL